MSELRGAFAASVTPLRQGGADLDEEAFDAEERRNLDHSLAALMGHMPPLDEAVA